jgi:hypothetical protein
MVESAQRGLTVPDFRPDQILTPELRALLSTLDGLRNEARDDWRPDLLDEVAEPWLEPAVAQVRDLSALTRRLTDPEVASESQALSLELRESQLALELKELLSLLEDSESEEATDLKVRIADTARARAEMVAASSRSTATHPPTVPWRYRSNEEDRRG